MPIARVAAFVLVVLAGLSAIRAGADAIDEPAAAAATPAAVPAAAGGSGSIADQPVDEEAYANTQTCINLRDIRSHTVLDERHVVFELRRGRYMLSQFKQRCDFLSQHDAIGLNTSGNASRLCALDNVNVLDRNTSWSRGTGAAEEAAGFRVVGRCHLGPFEEISRDQLIALKDAMKARRNASPGLWESIFGP